MAKNPRRKITLREDMDALRTLASVGGADRRWGARPSPTILEKPNVEVKPKPLNRITQTWGNEKTAERMGAKKIASVVDRKMANKGYDTEKIMKRYGGPLVAAPDSNFANKIKKPRSIGGSSASSRARNRLSRQTYYGGRKVEVR